MVLTHSLLLHQLSFTITKARDYHAIIRVGSDRLVLAWGTGDLAQLGLGHEEAFRERKFPAVVKAFNGHDVLQVAGLFDLQLSIYLSCITFLLRLSICM
jgi:alpha-tubulin suppressor-like RCC1 family protein